MPNKASDVIVVGGGVIGLSVAYCCAKSGLRVTVLERGELGREASWAGAGIISAARFDSARSTYGKFLGLSCELHAAWADELRRATGIDNGFRRCGGLEIGFDAADAHALRSAAGHHRKEGVAWNELSRDEARECEPALQTEFVVAYHIPEMAQLRNPRHTKALAAACARLGVQLRPGEMVVGFTRDGCRILGTRTCSGDFSAATTVVTTGAWTRGLLEPLGVVLPIRPIRGQIALLACDAPVLRHVIMIGKEYLVPRDDGRVLVGSTEEDAGFDKRPTVSGIRTLLDLAYRVSPALRSAALERTWAGLRPGTADGRPFVGPVPGNDGLIVAAGHYRSGLQLSTATAVVVDELIRGVQTSVPLHAFRLDRVSPDTPSD